MTASLLKKGVFLIANPQITTGIFHRSVILICEHSPYWSFGVIINKKANNQSIKEAHPGLQLLTNHGKVTMKFGGPVNTDQVIVIHNNPTCSYQSGKITHNAFIGINLGITSPEPSMQQSDFHLFIGHSGWSSGMLEREVAQGHWFIYDKQDIDIFTEMEEQMWNRLLSKMGGIYASMSTIPEDILMN